MAVRVLLVEDGEIWSSDFACYQRWKFVFFHDLSKKYGGLGKEFCFLNYSPW